MTQPAPGANSRRGPGARPHHAIRSRRNRRRDLLFHRLARACLPCVLLLAGCSTYNDKVAAVRQNWSAGSWEGALAVGKTWTAGRGDSRNEVLYGLEEGTLLRAAERFEESQAAYDSTWERIREMDEKAEVRISQQGLALLVNPGQTDYEARTYDRIMLHTYSALNHLTLGDPGAARVALNRAYQSQQRAVEKNSDRIRRTKKEIEENRDDTAEQIDVAKIAEAPETGRKLDALYEPVRSLEPYAPYVNPFSVYLDGLYFLNFAADGSDLERGLKSMERVHSLNPGSEWLREEYALARDIVDGKGQPDSVVVLFETGLPPIREAEKIELPLFLFGSDSVPYFAAAFPVLRFQSPFPAALSVEAGGETRRTSTIADMDRVIAQEFRDHESLVVTQAILSAATKAAVVYAARSQAKDGSAAQALIDIFGIVYQAATNEPDLRTWFTLPKQIQGTRVPMPEDRRLTIGFPGSNQKIEIALENGKVLVVHTRVTSTTANPVIHQFVLQ
ncbi:MAG: COG3014 family protein [Puniceicoccaceae bacterium]